MNFSQFFIRWAKLGDNQVICSYSYHCSCSCAACVPEIDYGLETDNILCHDLALL